MDPMTITILIIAAVAAVATFVSAKDHGASTADALAAAAKMGGAVVVGGGMLRGTGNFSPENLQKFFSSPAVQEAVKGYNQRELIDHGAQAINNSGLGTILVLGLGALLIYKLADTKE